MLRNLLSSVIIWLYGMYRRITDKPDFKIESKELEYCVNHEIEYTVNEGGFWDKESKYWNDKILNFYWVDVSDDAHMGEKVPENVSRVILRIKYWYNNKQYKFITNNIEVNWPYAVRDSMSFNIPLTNVALLDFNNKPIRDITSKVKKYGGPKSDFHGEDVSIHDFLRYEEDVLKDQLPKIKLTNALGMTKVVSTHEDTIKSLQIP